MNFKKEVKKIRSEQPMLLVLILFMIGVGLRYFFIDFAFNFSSTLFISLAVFLLFLSAIILNKNKLSLWIHPILVVFILVIFGFANTNIYLNNSSKTIETSSSDTLAIVKIKIQKIISQNDSLQKTYAYINEDINSNQYKSPAYLVYFKNVQQLEIHDELLASDIQIQEIGKALNPHQFDLKKWYNYKNVFHKIYLDKERIIEVKNSDFNIEWYCFQLSKKFQSIISTTIQDNEVAAILNGILLGADDAIDQNTRQVYAATGAAHILSVSGMHVGLILSLLSFLLKFLNKNRNAKILQFFIIAFLLIFYGMICGMGSSVMRAVLMCILMMIGKLFFKQIHTLNILWTTAFLLILFQPGIIFDVGFQLSFFAVLGLLLLYQPILNWMTFGNVILQSIWSITAVSIAAQITTLPLILYYFHNLTFISLIGNFLAAPLSLVILYGTILLLIFHKIIFIKTILVFVLKKSVFILNYGLNMLVIPNVTFIDNVTISFIQLIVFYIVIIFLVLYFNYQWKKFRTIFILSLACFITLEIIDDINQNLKKGMIIYSLNNGIELNIKEDNKLYIIENECNKSEQQFKTKNNKLYYGEVENIYIKSDTIIEDVLVYQNGILFYKNKIISLENSQEFCDLNIEKYSTENVDNKNTIFMKGKKYNENYVCNKDGAYVYSF